MLKIGDKAPAFRLFSDAKEEVSLANYQGKNLVLLFFPVAFTSVCTEELCQMRDQLAEYNSMGSEVVAISVDSPFTLERYKKDQQLNFPLLSDFNKETIRAYNSLYQDFVMGMKGVSKRSAFVIDKDGVIRYAEVLDNAGEMPNFEAVKETLNNLN
jgi:peroxiredoxin